MKWEHWLLVAVNIPFKINPSVVNFLILYPLKTQENQGFSVDLLFCPFFLSENITTSRLLRKMGGNV